MLNLNSCTWKYNLQRNSKMQSYWYRKTKIQIWYAFHQPNQFPFYLLVGWAYEICQVVSHYSIIYKCCKRDFSFNCCEFAFSFVSTWIPFRCFCHFSHFSSFWQVEQKHEVCTVSDAESANENHEQMTTLCFLNFQRPFWILQAMCKYLWYILQPPDILFTRASSPDWIVHFSNVWCL